MRYAPIITGLFVGLLAQCTNKTAEQPPRFGDSGAYCAGRAQAECNDQVIAACAASGKDRCVASRQTACLNELPLGKTYDAFKAQECVDSVAAAYADAKLAKNEIEAYRAACALVFDGTVVRNGACQIDTDCKQADGLACVLAPGSASGTCQVPRAVQPGDKCDTSDALCAAGYHCDATKYCVVNAASTEPCSAALPCKPTLKCGAAGTCEPKVLDGSACTADGDCGSDICEPGVNLCVAQITLAPTEPFCVSAR
jgi:hypothetical protein